LAGAAAALALLSACQQQQQAENQADSAATNNATVPPEAQENGAANSAAAVIPTQPVTREAAAKIMHDRHENYERMGDAMKAVTRELKEASPDLAAVRQHAATFAQLGPQMPSWFPPGSGPDVGKTEAKAEIWRKPEDFVAKSRAFTQAALAFQTAAGGNDVAAIKAAHGNLGKSCKACHDLYREEH
jgi:cytochrome c556